MPETGAKPLIERYRGHAVRRESWTIAGHSFDLCWPADIDALLDDPETQRRFDHDEYMPYWAQPWPSAVLLAERVVAGEPGRGRPAIEIGCGVGLVSLAAAARGWEVVCTDYDADAVAFAELNAGRNGLRLAGAQVLDYPRATAGAGIRTRIGLGSAVRAQEVFAGGGVDRFGAAA